jgi:hypothetical protein
MTKYNVSPLVAREIEFSTGTIFGGSSLFQSPYINAI